MRLHINQAGDANLVRAITSAGVIINGQAYTSSLIVTPNHIVADWKPQRLAELSIDDLLTVAALEPEVVLLGTGEQLLFPAPYITAPIIDRAMGLEVMDTPAACRTFNILASEGRKVAAALLIESPSISG